MSLPDYLLDLPCGRRVHCTDCGMYGDTTEFYPVQSVRESRRESRGQTYRCYSCRVDYIDRDRSVNDGDGEKGEEGES